ncbi:Protein of unknown function [Sphingomonas sp. YR710]|uniref:glycosyltransferase family 61 protein n=1 Tax=Sphingomonas sp. YR710 TaxID=1882773 RepID=UPI00087EA401|nr:glycosyltransferase family 61 protein [Sphingomonas sp. YR710]SDC06911.1 Protein of unknown function [Sphingomonas sp. YR710]
MVAVIYNIVRLEDAVTSMPKVVKFTQTSEGSHLARHVPSLVIGPGTQEFLEVYHRSNGAISPRGIFSIKEASVIGDGMIIRGNSMLMSASLMMIPEAFPGPWNSPIFHDRHGDVVGAHIPERRVRLSGTTVNMISLGWQVFGHMLVDVFPRFERMNRSGVAVDRYLFGALEAEWHGKVIEAAGIPIDKCEFIDVNSTIVDCDHMLLPTFDRLASELHPDIMNVHRRLRETYAPAVEPTRDIFVARSGWGGARELVNRREIEAIVAEAGFEIVFPEQVSFPEQVALFASARTVLGEAGSGMHGTLFSHPRTRVGVLQSKGNVNFIQPQIAAIGGQEIYIVLGDDEPGSGGQGWFSIDPNDARHIASLLRN